MQDEFCGIICVYKDFYQNLCPFDLQAEQGAEISHYGQSMSKTYNMDDF